MQEQMEGQALNTSLNNLKNLSERMTKNLEKVNQIITENINNGSGIWDSDSAKLYRERWENVMSDFPNIINTLNQQATNLEQFLENMKKIDEV